MTDSRHRTRVRLGYAAEIYACGRWRVDARLVYAKLGSGRYAKSEMLGTGIDEVMSHTGGRGWIAVDCGMDENPG